MKYKLIQMKKDFRFSFVWGNSTVSNPLLWKTIDLYLVEDEYGSRFVFYSTFDSRGHQALIDQGLVYLVPVSREFSLDSLINDFSESEIKTILGFSSINTYD
jgi:hypothetical protein